MIHEAALRIRVGDRLAARDQLARIIEASEADHITVRVIPFDLDDFSGADSAMVYVGGAMPQLDTVVRDGNACVEIGWQKSSFSGGAEGNECVELAASPTTIRLRESDTPTIELTTTPTTPTPLTHLLQAIQTGALHPRP